MPLPPPRKPPSPAPDPPPDPRPPDGSGKTKLPPPKRKIASDERDRLPDGRRVLPPPPPPMPRRRNPLLMILPVLGLSSLLVLGLFWLMSDDSGAPTMQDQIDKTRSWVRLNPLPKSATNVRFVNPDEGDNRYHIIFEAPAPDIENWIAASPGLQDVSPQFSDVGTVVYRIAASKSEEVSHSASVYYAKDKGAVDVAIAVESRKTKSFKW